MEVFYGLLALPESGIKDPTEMDPHKSQVKWSVVSLLRCKVSGGLHMVLHFLCDVAGSFLGWLCCMGREIWLASLYVVHAVDISPDVKRSSRLSLVMGHPLKTPNNGPALYLYKANWVWACRYGSLTYWSLTAGCHPCWRIKYNQKIVRLSPCVAILDGLSVNILVTLTLCRHFTLFKTSVSKSAIIVFTSFLWDFDPRGKCWLIPKLNPASETYAIFATNFSVCCRAVHPLVCD